MFSNLRNKLKEMIQKVIGAKTIEQTLHIAPIISNEMQKALTLWSDMYSDNSPWLKEPTYDNPVRITSLGLPAFIASEKARMVMLEMQSEITAPTEKIEKPNPDYIPPFKDDFGNIHQSFKPETITIEQPITPTERADYLNNQYHKKVLSKLRTQLEYGIAKGGLVIKPYYVAVNEPTENNIGEATENQENMQNVPLGQLEFDFIQADCFYPLSFDASGKITEAAFVQRKIDKNDVYTRLEYHKLENNTVIVQNRAFKSKNLGTQINFNDESDLGKEIPLTDVPEWAAFEPETIIKNVDRLLFAYFKMPEANTIDPHSPLGVSAYSRAIKLIEEADKQYSRMLWEFEGGELAIDVDRDALMEVDKDGNRIIRPKMQERLFRKIDLGAEGDTYNVFNPTFRDVSLINGLNSILMRIEDVCGLARGTIADVSAEARTATELKILKQRTYASIDDIQKKALQPCLEDLVYVMNVYCTLYNIVGDSPVDPKTGMVDTTNLGQYQVSFEWDDSTITDVESELGKRITLLQNGLTSKVEVRMWFFGETEQQAIDALQKVNEESTESMEQELTMQSNFNQ